MREKKIKKIKEEVIKLKITLSKKEVCKNIEIGIRKIIKKILRDLKRIDSRNKGK